MEFTQDEIDAVIATRAFSRQVNKVGPFTYARRKTNFTERGGKSTLYVVLDRHGSVWSVCYTERAAALQVEARNHLAASAMMLE